MTQTLKVKLLHLRSTFVFDKFEQGGGTQYIDEAIVLDRQALDLCPPGHSMRSDSLFELQSHLRDRFDHLGDINDIDEAIALTRETVELCPAGHSDRWASLANLALNLANRYNQLGEVENIAEAIALEQEALELCSSGDPNRSLTLSNLAVRLYTRFQCLGDESDLNEAIAFGQESIELRPPGHPDRSTSLNNVANYVHERYQRSGEVEDLEEAARLGKEALELRPPGHPDRAMSLSNFSLVFRDRYRRLGAMEDLEQAIEFGREAIELSKQSYLGLHSMALNNVSSFLRDRYQQLGEMSDLDEAIVLGRKALDLRPPGHPLRSSSLTNVAGYCHERYGQLGDMTDLHEAIILGQESLDLRPHGDPNRSLSLSNLANFFHEQYKQLGALTDLNEAIVLGREALELRPQGNIFRSSSLANVANYFQERYLRLQGMTDLEEAIVLGREALDLHPPGNPERSMTLNNVANLLHDRYLGLRERGDLDEALVLGREALELRPPGHPDRALSLMNLANYVRDLYLLLGDMTELNEAIVLGREALELYPPGNPHRLMSFNNVAHYLHERYKKLGGMEDLDDAIDIGQQGLELCPWGHPQRSQSLVNLASYLRARFTESNQSEDEERMFGLYAKLEQVPSSVSSADLLAAKAWVNAAEDFHHSTTLLAYEIALRSLVLHLATLPSLPEHLPIIRNLTSSLAVDSFSACLRSRCPSKGIELLEQGRSVFWNQISRLRSPLEDVVASGPEGKSLADEFGRLSSRIQDAIHSPGQDQHDRLCGLNVELQQVITDIRKLSGHERFLLPSLFSDLQRAASGGPVIVINASKYTCDALVVFHDLGDPIHIPLHITKARVQDLALEIRTLSSRARKTDVKNDLGRFLRDLWDEIVSPIVDVLQPIVARGSRIWWCPTAEFSLLPLHAAGPYRKGERNLSNVYISSYTPTLTALIRARRHDAPNSATDETHFLAIGEADVGGANELASIGTELAIIGQRMQSLATFTRIEGSESSVSRVSEELKKNEWVHLSCHGIPDQTYPFESAFALHDGHFTIERIMQCDLENAQFAYLSACHTTVGDEESPDEVIHLASAMQFAGFRSVIGTMWAVGDVETIQIVSKFYEHMVDEGGRLDHTRAALALNKTMKQVDIPLDQRILYVHIGA